MKLIALLSWFDEPLPALATCLTTLSDKLGVEEVVALDGRYALYPGEEYLSSPDQAAAIYVAAEQLGMRATVIKPDGPWPGEVEKRTALFAYGLERAEPGDWFMVMDSDQVVAEADDIRPALAESDLDVADITFRDTTQGAMMPAGFPSRFSMRIFFRAQPINVVGHHAYYVSGDGRVLWSADTRNVQVDGLDLTERVLIDHRPQARPTARLHAKHVYYTARDEAGVEFGICRCGEPSRVRFYGRWRIVKDKLVGEILTTCRVCEAKQRSKDRRRLLYLGVDPDSVNPLGEFYGKAPGR